MGTGSSEPNSLSGLKSLDPWPIPPPAQIWRCHELKGTVHEEDRKDRQPERGLSHNNSSGIDLLDILPFLATAMSAIEELS